ncbi:MAG: putative metal-binding motif-containing protein [Planctomycetota bacterium]|jgi:hypothetical protein
MPFPSRIIFTALLSLAALACIDPCSEPEVPYDGIDNDCDDTTPDDDLDGDGFALVDDCDDEDSEVNPDAVDVCDGIDNDCSGGPADLLAVDCITYWRSDWDGDGYGNPATEECECDVPADAVLNGDDCDDGRAVSYPGAEEICDTVDNDCDGYVDEDLPTHYFYDYDGDGYGNPATAVEGCTLPPSGSWVFNGDDCDDANELIYPGAQGCL